MARRQTARNRNACLAGAALVTTSSVPNVLALIRSSQKLGALPADNSQRQLSKGFAFESITTQITPSRDPGPSSSTAYRRLGDDVRRCRGVRVFGYY